MQTTLINNDSKTITTYELTNELVSEINDMFSTMFSKEEPCYSLGFQRYQKLNRNKKQQLDIDYFDKGHAEAKLFLESMTDAEFKNYKKSK